MEYVLGILRAEKNRLENTKADELAKTDSNWGIIVSAERDLSELYQAINILEMVC